MSTIMKIENMDTIEALILGNQLVAFSVLGNKTERYHFIRKTLVRFDYITLPRKNKGIVIRCLIKTTEYSRQQLTRLIKQYIKTGRINRTPCRNNGFTKRYTDNDIALLAKTDELNDTPCMHTVKKLCESAHEVFDDKAYQGRRIFSFLLSSHLVNIGFKKCSAFNYETRI